MNGRVAPILLALLPIWACEGKSSSSPALSKAAKAGSEARPAKVEAEAKAPAANAVKAGPEAEARLDPPWFRADLVPEAKVVKRSRSQESQSMFLLDFPAGTTIEDCIAKLKEKIEPHVSLAPAPGEGKQGQLTLKGDHSEYHVTVVCGDAKGTTRAYVGYQWGK